MLKSEGCLEHVLEEDLNITAEKYCVLSHDVYMSLFGQRTVIQRTDKSLQGLEFILPMSFESEHED